MVFSGIAIGFMGFGVWAHHLFASGLGPISVAAFSIPTMFIEVPTGVKMLNWMAKLWGGQLTFIAPMLWDLGLVTSFPIRRLHVVSRATATHHPTTTNQSHPRTPPQ